MSGAVFMDSDSPIVSDRPSVADHWTPGEGPGGVCGPLDWTGGQEWADLFLDAITARLRALGRKYDLVRTASWYEVRWQ